MKSRVELLTDEIRDVVQGVYGAPTRTRRGVVVVISQGACSPSLAPCWVAKVKYGSLIVAKCGKPACGHFSPVAALESLLSETQKALGVAS